ncbi:hypothetical protein M404DRAFT_161846 [Pisolithus tinctorius Marx 270]|uniref:Uncharacterized protein n=1 Tax=Pisolithus tinctorius Marx 270 TaxID=870435 RepID=A0A0C3JH33_PISTI|nr:hypothetical protein M404DRAFT_161846 [Pisolithus tinctorius Marx 270]
MPTAGQLSGLGTALTWTFSSPNRLQSDKCTINPVTSFVENVKSSANSSSWRAQNPGVPVQPIKARAPRLLSTAKKCSRSLTKEDKAKRAKELHDALKSFLHSQNAKLEAIAVANNVTFDHVKGLINTKTNYHHSHRAMLQNALVHAKSLKVNTDRPVGEKLPMARLQELVKVDLEVHPLSQSEEELLIEKLQEYRELKTRGTRMNNTAMAHDVNYMVDRITKELKNLRDRTGIYATLFVTRGHVNDTIQSTWTMTNNSADFWQDVIQQPVADIARKYEQWACTQGQSNVFHNTALNNTTGQATNKRNIVMNYLNYEHSIILAYGVKLVGWPTDVKFVNPSSIGIISEVIRLRDALRSGTCFWKKLSKRERQEFSAQWESRVIAGEAVLKSHKKRADAGVSRKHKAPSGAELSTDKENRSEGPPRKRSHGSRKRTLPKSVEFIQDTDDDDNEEDLDD